MPRTGRPRTEVKLEEEQRDFLQRLVARRSAPAREVLHARIILLTSGGLSNKEVAKGLSTCEHTVSYWRRRFGRLGLEGLSEMPRAGAPRRISDEQVEKVMIFLRKRGLDSCFLVEVNCVAAALKALW